MTSMRQALYPAVCLMLCLIGTHPWAEPAAGPYDATADARAEISAAMAVARATDRLVLIEFGANWCPDCRRFAELLEHPDVAPAVEEAFVVARVDVGNWDHNLDVVEAWGNPIEGGIPAAVFVDRERRVIAATRAGEISTARNFDAAHVLAFLDGVLQRGVAESPIAPEAGSDAGLDDGDSP